MVVVVCGLGFGRDWLGAGGVLGGSTAMSPRPASCSASVGSRERRVRKRETRYFLGCADVFSETAHVLVF